MPSRKAPKRKVKEVVVPKGTEGEQLSVAERKAKLESFIEQFDLEVEMRLAQFEKDHRAVCKTIENTGRSMILKLTPEQANMSVLEYRKQLLNKTRNSRESDADSLMDVSALLSDIQSKQAAVPTKTHKAAGFATPAAGSSRQTLWTATPKETPMFDKRLLNVTTGKPTGLSLNAGGKPVDLNVLDKKAKAEYAKYLEAMLQQLKS